MQELPQEGLCFPTTIHCAIIAENTPELEPRLRRVLLSQGVPHAPVATPAGRFRRYRVRVDLRDREHMNTLYQALANVEGVRFVL
jgi:putative lipoic acid-binding regulatory protein